MRRGDRDVGTNRFLIEHRDRAATEERRQAFAFEQRQGMLEIVQGRYARGAALTTAGRRPVAMSCLANPRSPVGSSYFRVAMPT